MGDVVEYEVGTGTIHMCGKLKAAALAESLDGVKVFDLTGGPYKMDATKCDGLKVYAANKKNWAKAGDVAAAAISAADSGTPVIVNCNAGAERTALVAARIHIAQTGCTPAQAKAWLAEAFGTRTDISYADYEYASGYLDQASAGTL